MLNALFSLEGIQTKNTSVTTNNAKQKLVV